MSKVEQYITSIPDFPKEGIIFRDITTVLGDADGFHLAVDEMTALLDGVEFDAIAGLESRGFLFGAPMAYNLHKAFIPIRKQGKLPRATSRMSYELEYGMETIEVHRDDIKPGMKIVVVDDLIATGGTLEAAVHLLEQLKGRKGCLPAGAQGSARTRPHQNLSGGDGCRLRGEVSKIIISQ